MTDYNSIIDRYYPAGTPLRDIYIRHCRAVAQKALEIADRAGLPIDRDTIEAAAMLHDIGIFATNAGEEIAAVAERHTGSGITAKEIIDRNLPLPHCDYCPRTQLERLVCYADKFFSKSGDMTEKSLEQAMSSAASFGNESLERFMAMHSEFTGQNTPS